MPAAYENNVFMVCDGDLQDEVGTYTSNGQTYTWSQPSSLPATSTLPWTPRIPASSNCVTYQSTDLWPTSDLGYLVGSSDPPTSSMTTSTTTTSMSGMAVTTMTGGNSQSRSGSGTSATASPTKTSGATRQASAGYLCLVVAILLMW